MLFNFFGKKFWNCKQKSSVNLLIPSWNHLCWILFSSDYRKNNKFHILVVSIVKMVKKNLWRKNWFEFQSDFLKCRSAIQNFALICQFENGNSENSIHKWNLRAGHRLYGCKLIWISNLNQQNHLFHFSFSYYRTSDTATGWYGIFGYDGIINDDNMMTISSGKVTIKKSGLYSLTFFANLLKKI